MKVKHCSTCGSYVKPDCDWRQGRCPHRPSMLDTILNDPYKARYLNLVNFIKGLFRRG
jgi:hypothetical protein